MNHREVMQQALEAIRIFREWETGQDYESCRATVLARALAAEESLGAALAGFDADPQNVGQTQTESKQEPVAWMVYTEGGKSAYVTDNPTDLVGAYRALPLYTR